jgi:hypothetical protein
MLMLPIDRSGSPDFCFSARISSKRRGKSDRLDAVKLVEMLIRWCNGERKVWGVVHTPSVANEDHRQLHRELIVL